MSKTPLFANKREEMCPECGGYLVIRSGSHGPFHGCANYPECEFIRSFKSQADSHIVKVIEGKVCPDCQGTIVLRQGRYGMFIGCLNYPECHYIESINDKSETEQQCPQCKTGILLQRKSRFGKTFYACNGYPVCQFALNHKPVAGVCTDCQFPLLLEKKTAHGIRQFCANKLCGKVVKDRDNE